MYILHNKENNTDAWALLIDTMIHLVWTGTHASEYFTSSPDNSKAHPGSGPPHSTEEETEA